MHIHHVGKPKSSNPFDGRDNTYTQRTPESLTIDLSLNSIQTMGFNFEHQMALKYT